MMIVIYFRYSSFRSRSLNNVSELQKKLLEETALKKEFEYKYSRVAAVDGEKIEGLLREIDELHKEKEGEIKLRLAAEKQIELALRKTEDIEKRMNDWRVVQEAAMKDSKNAIIEVGNDLYKKLNESYKVEIASNQNLIGKVTQFFDKFSGAPIATTSAKVSPHQFEDKTKKLVFDFSELAKASGNLVGKNYFLSTSFNEQKSKLFLCEFAFISGEKLHIIDFKACHYLAEFNLAKTQNELAAQINLTQKLDKYFIYLSNPKYRDSILKVFSESKIKVTKAVICAVVPTKIDLQTLKEFKYLARAEKLDITVSDFDSATNIIL